MKKFFLCVFFLPLIILLPQIVHAEKTDWFDKSYNFRGIKKIVLFDVTSSVAVEGNEAVRFKIQGDYQDKASKKTKCEIITEDQARKLLGLSTQDRYTARDIIKNNISTIADAWIECNIGLWKDSYYIVPARTVWEDRKMTRHHRRSDGTSWDETYYITVPVTYPPYRVDVSDLAVSFKVYGANNGSEIFVREDIRSRNDAVAQKNMFSRMCNSFFEDFKKKIK